MLLLHHSFTFTHVLYYYNTMLLQVKPTNDFVCCFELGPFLKERKFPQSRMKLFPRINRWLLASYEKVRQRLRGGGGGV